MGTGVRAGVIACVVGFLVFPAVARADIITFSDEGAFLAATGPISLESFEDEAATNSVGTAAIVTPGLAFALSTTDNSAGWGVRNDSWGGVSATHGSNWLGIASGVPMTIYISDFLHSGSLGSNTAFGMTIMDFGDYATGTLTIAIGNSGGDVATTVLGAGADGNQRFFGVMSTAGSLSAAVLTCTADNDSFGLDEIYFGTPATPAVPEPATLALFGLGAGALALRRRKRKLA